MMMENGEALLNALTKRIVEEVSPSKFFCLALGRGEPKGSILIWTFWWWSGRALGPTEAAGLK